MKYKKYCLILLMLFIGIVNIYATKRPLVYWSVALNNYATAQPFSSFSKLFYAQCHPGITISTGFNWKEAPKHNWTQSFKAGFLNHRYVQNSFLLYTEFGYRYKVGSKWGFSIAAGGGYLHMIPATQQFKMNSDGEWEEKKIKSRPQAMISLSMGIDYKITATGIRTFLRYQNILQTPFVPGYVPLLPYNVIHLGVTVPVALLKKKEGKNGK